MTHYLGSNFKPSRINRTFTILALLTVIASRLIWTNTAYACTAPIGGLDAFSIKRHVDASEVVFLGKVINQYEYPPTQPATLLPHQDPFEYYVEVEVSNYFKGEGKETIAIARFGSSHFQCLQDISLNDSYIFYGDLGSFYEEIDFSATYLLTHQATSQPTQENIQLVLDALNPNLPLTPTPRIYLPLIVKNEAPTVQNKNLELSKINRLLKSSSLFFNKLNIFSN